MVSSTISLFLWLESLIVSISLLRIFEAECCWSSHIFREGGSSDFSSSLRNWFYISTISSLSFWSSLTFASIICCCVCEMGIFTPLNAFSASTMIAGRSYEFGSTFFILFKSTLESWLIISLIWLWISRSSPYYPPLLVLRSPNAFNILSILFGFVAGFAYYFGSPFIYYPSRFCFDFKLFWAFLFGKSSAAFWLDIYKFLFLPIFPVLESLVSFPLPKFWVFSDGIRLLYALCSADNELLFPWWSIW